MPGQFEQGWRRVVCIASGPSFTHAHAAIVERARRAGRCRVIACNTTALTHAPNADAMYAPDPAWWTEYADTGPGPQRWSAFGGQRWTAHQVPAKAYGARYIRADKRRDGLPHDLRSVTGGNSGQHMAVLAYLFGAECIALCGYDMKRGAHNETHCHGDHPQSLHNSTPDAYKSWAKRFDALARDLTAAGVGVVNCSPDSALKQFPHCPLEEIFA